MKRLAAKLRSLFHSLFHALGSGLARLFSRLFSVLPPALRSRLLGLFDRAKNYLLIRGFFILHWLIFLTCRKSYSPTKMDEQPYLVLFWHGRLLMMSFVFRHFRLAGKEAYVMISRHEDGERVARLIKFYGLRTVRGSSARGGAGAGREAFKVLAQGSDVVLTPDGPRGPLRSISDGSVLIAQRAGVGVRIINFEASSFWLIRTSWDELVLPRPFSRLVFSLGEPFSLAGLELDEAKARIREEFAKAELRDRQCLG